MFSDKNAQMALTQRYSENESNKLNDLRSNNDLSSTFHEEREVSTHSENAFKKQFFSTPQNHSVLPFLVVLSDIIFYDYS